MLLDLFIITFLVTFDFLFLLLLVNFCFFEVLDGLGTFSEVERVEVFDLLEGVSAVIDLTAVENSDGDAWVLVNICGDTSDGTNDFNSRNHLPEHNVLAI